MTSLTPRAENAKIDVKVIGASQEMCNYLPLLQKLPAALVIRKVKVTKHKGRVLLRTTLCAFSSFGKGKIIAHNLGTKIGLISHIYFGIFCTGCPVLTCSTLYVDHLHDDCDSCAHKMSTLRRDDDLASIANA